MDKYLKYIPENWLSVIGFVSDLFKRYKFILLTVFFCFYIYIIYSKVVSSSYGLYQYKLTAIAQAKKIFAKEEKEIMSKDKIASEVMQVNAALQSINEKFFDLKSFNEYSINTLPRIIESTGSKVLIIRYEKILKLEKGLIGFPMELSFWGSFSAAMDAIETLENNEKLIRI
jgi:hypothetical protein